MGDCIYSEPSLLRGLYRYVCRAIVRREPTGRLRDACVTPALEANGERRSNQGQHYRQFKVLALQGLRLANITS